MSTLVQVAAGGVHSAALTHDNRILTWGVNDEGTLARDTKQDRKESDAPSSDYQITDDNNVDEVKPDSNSEDDDDDDDDDDEVTLNIKEATPLPIESSLFPHGTVFTQLVATDSATFALTKDGRVYGWGTFRGTSGSIKFFPDTEKKIQKTPILIPGLNNVTKLAAGAQHVLALTSTGSVFSWGNNEQYQLGRRRASRSRGVHPLLPDQSAIPRGITAIGAGLYHSFAIHKNGDVYGWGSNNFGQTGIPTNAGESDAVVVYPTQILGFRKHPQITAIQGGKDHSIAVSQQGQCLTWGRIENLALGFDDPQSLPSWVTISDIRGRPRILLEPQVIPSLENVVFATAGTDTSFALTAQGQAYSWGFNVEGQAGHPDADEIKPPTPVKSKHIDGKKLVSAAAGGQFSIIMGEPAK
ncbi:hypothetical protein EYZ11_013417 [Aspergillus tanneri]|uniref:RCC1-like domain-containing protein n=1 Tax=Aspergillus tanneri TaxID=1220188 RepID=A0A4S3IZU0_9EURO|nr:hypothetical protein EYZ11_013417 [Aspergillus tanneri]